MNKKPHSTRMNFFNFFFCGGKTRFTYTTAANKRTNLHFPIWHNITWIYRRRKNVSEPRKAKIEVAAGISALISLLKCRDDVSRPLKYHQLSNEIREFELILFWSGHFRLDMEKNKTKIGMFDSKHRNTLEDRGSTEENVKQWKETECPTPFGVKAATSLLFNWLKFTRKALIFFRCKTRGF